jgi:hypothetical protein
VTTAESDAASRLRRDPQATFVTASSLTLKALAIVRAKTLSHCVEHSAAEKPARRNEPETDKEPLDTLQEPQSTE